MVETDTNASDLAFLQDVVREAGEIGLRYFNAPNRVSYKSGNSPVTEADMEIDSFLKSELMKRRPTYGWLSEETEDNLDRLSCHRVFIVDPIDGTRGFIDGRKEWCISIAIVEKNKPVVAALHCPSLGQSFFAVKGGGISLVGCSVESEQKTNHFRVTASKKVIDFIDTLGDDTPFVTTPFIPSLAYRLAMVSQGRLEAAFARGGACEWDVAAAELLLSEANCSLTTAKGEALGYNQEIVKLPALIACKTTLHDRLLSIANSTGIIQ